MLEHAINKGWAFWLTIMLIIFFILWLFYGGGDHEYIGLSPLQVGVDSSKYVSKHKYDDIQHQLARSDLTPVNTSYVDYYESYEDDDFNCDDITFEDTQVEDIKFAPVSGRKVSKGEAICKAVLEELYSKEFHTVRPDFLKNPETKRNLELDCYNEELRLAVEYNGIQHYKWPNFTGQSKEAFIKQVRRDQYKVEACDNNGVYLITVPYTVPHDQIRDYIIKYLPENRVENI